MNRRPTQSSFGTSASGAPNRDLTKRLRRERGAAAVEFALVMPILLTLALGIVEFGRAYNVQTTLAAAAREGARTMALKNNVVDAKESSKLALSPAVPSPEAVVINIVPSATGGCTANLNATVTLTYSLPYMTKFFGTTIPLTGKGVMRCGG